MLFWILPVLSFLSLAGASRGGGWEKSGSLQLGWILEGYAGGFQPNPETANSFEIITTRWMSCSCWWVPVKLPIIPMTGGIIPANGRHQNVSGFYPNVMIGIAYYHRRMDRAGVFVRSDANPTEANRGLLYRHNIEAKPYFLQKTTAISTRWKFWAGTPRKSGRLSAAVEAVTGYIAELLDKDYDTSWMKRAKNRRRLRMAEVYLQQQRNQKKRRHAAPPKGRTWLMVVAFRVGR